MAEGQDLDHLGVVIKVVQAVDHFQRFRFHQLGVIQQDDHVVAGGVGIRHELFQAFHLALEAALGRNTERLEIWRAASMADLKAAVWI